MHPLDNVIWNALTTRDAQFAQGTGIARRFIREIGPLAGFEKHGDAGYESLAQLVNPGDTVGVFLDAPYSARAGWTYVVGAPLLQMVCESAAAIPGAANGSEL